MTSDPTAFDPDAARSQINADVGATVLAAAASRLIDAYNDYEDALDRRVTMAELQLFDHEVERAERAHTAALSSDAQG